MERSPRGICSTVFAQPSLVQSLTVREMCNRSHPSHPWGAPRSQHQGDHWRTTRRRHCTSTVPMQYQYSSSRVPVQYLCSASVAQTGASTAPAHHQRSAIRVLAQCLCSTSTEPGASQENTHVVQVQSRQRNVGAMSVLCQCSTSAVLVEQQCNTDRASVQ